MNRNQIVETAKEYNIYNPLTTHVLTFSIDFLSETWQINTNKVQIVGFNVEKGLIKYIDFQQYFKYCALSGYLPENKEAAKEKLLEMWQTEQKLEELENNTVYTTLVRVSLFSEYMFTNQVIFYLGLWALSKGEIKVVSDIDDIKYYYLRDNYYNHFNGCLAKSCMAGEKHQDYLNFYDGIADLIVFLINGKVAARSLIWKYNNNQYYDVIYYYSRYNYALKLYFKKHSIKNVNFDDVKIKLPQHIVNYKSFPYLDSLYLSDGEYIYNYGEHIYKLSSTKGNLVYNNEEINPKEI